MISPELKNWSTYQLALRAAKTAISTLESAGVRALPVKGILLAQQIYDPAERPIADVDLIVSRADFTKAVTVARRSHWELVWDSKTLGNVNFIVHGVAVDVMSALGPAGLTDVAVSALLTRAAPRTDPLGFLHWQMEQHDHTLLLAIDAFKDKLGWGKPWAREDLVRLAQRGGFSAATLVKRAEEARLQSLLAIVANWILAAGPSIQWSDVRRRLHMLRLRPRYMERYEARVRARPTSTVARWHLSALTRAASDSRTRCALALALGAVGAGRFLLRHSSLRANPWDAQKLEI
jgi:hypothetical protein